MGGKGKVAILNAPPGIIIRDQRTNGFVDGLKKDHPQIEVVADQVADWDRKKAQDVLHTILAAHPDLGGVYGVNDSMALGAVDVAKEKGSHRQARHLRQRRRGRGARVDRGRRTDRHAIYRRLPAGAPCRRRGDGTGDRRRPGDGVRPSGSSADALCHRHQDRMWRRFSRPSAGSLLQRRGPPRNRLGPPFATCLHVHEAPPRHRSARSVLRGDRRRSSA